MFPVRSVRTFVQLCCACVFAAALDGQASIGEIVLWPGASATVTGNWVVVSDATAAGGARLRNPNLGLAKASASATPADYFEMTFDAEAGRPYRLWIRARADGNSYWNDSVSVQFSGSVSTTGQPVFRIGTTSATAYVLEDCSGCAISNWGWQDNGYGAGVLGPTIRFATTGPQTIRIQRREDGISIDQIVLSASRFLTASPGATTNDSTILPQTGDDGGGGVLPAGWQAQDVGDVGQPGSASESGGTYTISGAGADIYGSADAFHYAYRAFSGNGTIVARVAAIQGSDRWTKMGVMIRQNLTAGSAHASMFVSLSRGVAFQRRTTAGGLSTSTSGGDGTRPRWVRLVRAGNMITASVSPDGQVWTVVGQDTFAMTADVLVGLAASSHDRTAPATGTFDNVAVTAAPAGGKPWDNGRLSVTSNGRFLRHQTTGSPFFYLADTPWGIFKRLSRTSADEYLRDTAAKGFTAIQGVALWRMSSRGNAYDDSPLGLTDGKYDPSKVLVTPGNNPAVASEYDYWDHVDYIFDKAEQYGLYVAFVPTWGSYVSGVTPEAFDMSSNIFTVANARSFGEFLGRRYGGRPNVIWLLGGDRSAVYSNGDFRPVWRSMAEGIGFGATGQAVGWNEPHAAWDQLMMTYHPRRPDNPGSSLWFHDDPWLDFNGIESEFDEIVGKLQTDWNRTPAKPTALLEGRYEDELTTDRILFTGAFKQRYQLYHAIFAGSLGYAYGHKSIWDFLTTGKTWRMALNDPGRVAMATIRRLLDGFSNTELMNRVPDQSLVDGAAGAARTEDLIIAMRGGDARFALVYSTNGRDIRLNLARLAAGTADAYWFSPRSGRTFNGAGVEVTTPFATVATGPAAGVAVFNPPGSAGADNDWILKLRVR